ncbi:MAG: hypothetical protein FWG74_01975 [Planctomycetes bacterium]|nr:hypothetical protein [Planctomycetota bacterium]
MIWVIGIVVLALIVFWFMRGDGKPVEIDVPLLPQDFNPRNASGTYGAASYYASAVKWNRYDLLVAAADMPLDNWVQHMDTMVILFGQREEMINQCARAFNEKVETDPCLAVDEDLRALLGLARQFGYARIMSAAAFTGIEVEMHILGWLDSLLPDWPREAIAAASRLMNAHWSFCEKEGRYSAIPDHLRGCNVAEPEWKKTAELEDELDKRRRMMRDVLARVAQ